MISGLTADAETRFFKWMFTDPSNPSNAITQPIVVRLMAVSGNEITLGTEIIGDSYTPGDSTWSVVFPPDGSYRSEITNTVDVFFSTLSTTSTVNVVGIELWDSSSTPIRLAWADLPSTQTIPANSPLTLGATQIKVALT